MKKILVRATIGIVVLMLSGCWDQQLLKNERNVSIGGMDQGPNGMLKATVSIRDITVTEAGSKDSSEVHTVVARSTQHARELIDEEVSGGYSPAKMRVLLFGEELVRNHDIMPYLDVYYRDSKSPLNARIAVTKGTAQEMVQLKKIATKTIGLYIDDLLNSQEEGTAIPKVNIQTLHPLDRGYDFSLPYLLIREGMPTVDGIALFSGIKMTETLDLDESRIYLLLTGLKNKNLRLTLKSVDREKTNSYNYVTIDVKKLKRKLKVSVSGEGDISVNLNLKLRVAVVEDPSNHLYKMRVMHELEKFLSGQLTEEARTVVRTMQRSEHDGLGIARRLMSYHPKIWKKLDWEEAYPRIMFNTNVSVQIVNTGITQ
ncbi:Ger(x)C family spore germination protein [Cohnella herbarum]|uniref:Ger(X)C family spore germination protein n=1 Tax=Cohnella herbarum TaxID=2728023 RepID=A0A7Z2VLV8_9BACL|nr:Ger(x)C family spore germination protein [Cohnella herbarum]QJD85442.1 Ger(x)C family spore germination protein [Cohnella herbarum]